ncbi:MAG: MarR family winged helix-turn-helix transcriptional regulator [Peptococcaceae bacterium]|nr:MarR family winged helix-turn-helix transcriptional regulator [Peptococcaceae bacterium]
MNRDRENIALSADGNDANAQSYHTFRKLKQEYRENRLFQLLYKCSHLFLHRSNRHQGKNRILLILLAHGDMTQRELLAHTDIRSASLSELLAKIEANGDITRARSKENARNVNVALTEKGRREAECVREEQLALSKELLAPLSEAEQAQLEQLLLKMLLGWQRLPEEMKHEHKKASSAH